MRSQRRFDASPPKGTTDLLGSRELEAADQLDHLGVS
jgi:hypothetical protein